MRIPRLAKISAISLIASLVIIAIFCVIFSKDISDYFFKKGNGAVGFDKRAESIADFSWAIFFDHKNSDAYFFRGMTKARGPDPDLDGAIADFDQSLFLYKDGRAYKERAQAKAAKYDYDGALQDANEALKDLGGEFDVPGYILRGSLRSETNDLEGAIADYRKALSIYPDDRVVYNRLGPTEYFAGHNAEAVTDLHKLLELDPDRRDMAHLMIWIAESEDSQLRDTANKEMRSYLNDPASKPELWMMLIGRYLDGETTQNDFLLALAKDPALKDMPGLSYMVVGIKSAVNGDSTSALKYLQMSAPLRAKSNGKPDPLVAKWLKQVGDESTPTPTAQK